MRADLVFFVIKVDGICFPTATMPLGAQTVFSQLACQLVLDEESRNGIIHLVRSAPPIGRRFRKNGNIEISVEIDIVRTEGGRKINWLPRDDRYQLQWIAVLAVGHINITCVNGIAGTNLPFQ